MLSKELLTRDQLITHSKGEFQQAGFSVSDENIKSNAFDFIAKKSDLTNRISSNEAEQKIIIKTLVDLDLFRKHTSIELQLISKLISGFPILIAAMSNGKTINDATLYRRHDVSAISLNTLRMFLQATTSSIGNPKITKFAQRGGIYVNISNDRLKERRHQLRFDMNILAKKVGISRNALYKYEKGECSPKLSNFRKLTKILGTNLAVPLDILESQFNSLDEAILKKYKLARSQLQKEVTSYLAEKDFDVLWFKSEVFDGFSTPSSESSSSKRKLKNNYPIITGVSSNDEKNDLIRIECITYLSQFLQKQAIWFKDDDKEEDIQSDSSKLITVNISDLEQMATIEFDKLISNRNNLISKKNSLTN